MTLPTEYTYVERPFLDQLAAMGWEVLDGCAQDPARTEREGFRQVLLEGRLRAALRRINLDADGQGWLDDSRLNRLVLELQRVGGKLMEANERATELLWRGTAIEGLPERDGGRDLMVRYLDFRHPERNDFLAVRQFRVDVPGSATFILPDIVLFVNGIPLVVVECKSPAATDPLNEGIQQLLRYSNQRGEGFADDGAERLFHTNQLLVSTCFDLARVGTIGASFKHFLEWKDTSPVPSSEVAAALGVARLSGQQCLVAGMLRPAHLLDLVRHFTLFKDFDGRRGKVVARYQQFRAVHEAVRRLKTGATRLQDGEHDRRGGVVWHTQGSGKSLTMVFLVRKMRSEPELRRFKVVVVTDRTDLERQLSDTAALTGETVRKAAGTRDLKRILAEPGPDLVFAMIQKYLERSPVVALPGGASPSNPFLPQDLAAEEEGLYDGDLPPATEELFPTLNPSEDILVLVDEAHRTHTSTLHANLMKALPNAARIGFTGTPILLGARKRTHEIFGEYLDRYTIRESEADGMTVPILYEGRTAEGEVADGGSLDRLFEDMFREHTPQELQAIQARYATRGQVLEARDLIAAKARDLLRHYVDVVLPNGFKAMVVAVSRRAAVRYREALVAAQAELVRDLSALDPALLALSAEALAARSADEQLLVRAHARLEAIRALDFAAVISFNRNHDDAAWKVWTDGTRQKELIARFKQPLQGPKSDPLAFLCVNSMLLTGFDVPHLQVLYLDRGPKEHELLQAIARVNRTHEGKSHGLVVDYFGVARHLQEALAAYSSEDVAGVMASLKDELPRLEDRHRRVVGLFRDLGAGLDRPAECVDLLRDVKLRARFAAALKLFLESLDIVLPRPEALPYVGDARTLGWINKVAANRYRDDQLNIAGLGGKVRELVDRHLVSSGIDPRIPPISILDAGFDEEVERHEKPRTRASEMEHALRHHIRERFNEDPARYRKLSERLEAILRDLHDNWEALVAALGEIVDEVRHDRQENDAGLDPRTQAPFLRLLKEEVHGDGPVDPEELQHLARHTVRIVEHLRGELRAVDFWRKHQAQLVLRQWLVEYLDDEVSALPFARCEAVADRLMELAQARRDWLAG